MCILPSGLAKMSISTWPTGPRSLGGVIAAKKKTEFNAMRHD